MARYSTYWKFIPTRMVREYKRLKKDHSLQAQLYVGAIDTTIELTKLIQDGEARNRLVNMVYIEKTHTIEGAGMKMYLSRSTVAKWVGEFVDMLSYLAGFTDFIPPIYRQVYRQTSQKQIKFIDDIQARTTH